jgi:hypothetical protein
MSRGNRQTVLKSLSCSTLDQVGDLALEAVLKNLRILGQTLPRPETYERARMAAVEVMLKANHARAPYWLRFHYSLLDLARKVRELTRRLSHRERDALHFIEVIIDDNELIIGDNFNRHGPLP